MTKHVNAQDIETQLVKVYPGFRGVKNAAFQRGSSFNNPHFREYEIQLATLAAQFPISMEEYAKLYYADTTSFDEDEEYDPVGQAQETPLWVTLRKP